MVGKSVLPLVLAFLLSMAVPAMLMDFECMLGGQECCACHVDSHPEAAPDECSVSSLAALEAGLPDAPPCEVDFLAPPPAAPTLARQTVEPRDARTPREGPPPLLTGLRAPPA